MTSVGSLSDHIGVIPFEWEDLFIKLNIHDTNCELSGTRRDIPEGLGLYLKELLNSDQMCKILLSTDDIRIVSFEREGFLFHLTLAKPVLILKIFSDVVDFENEVSTLNSKFNLEEAEM